MDRNHFFQWRCCIFIKLSTVVSFSNLHKLPTKTQNSKIASPTLKIPNLKSHIPKSLCGSLTYNVIQERGFQWEVVHTFTLYVGTTYEESRLIACELRLWSTWNTGRSNPFPWSSRNSQSFYNCAYKAAKYNRGLWTAY